MGGWGLTLFHLLMQAQQHSAVKLTGQLLGAPRLLRVNEITRPGSYSLDDPTKVSELIQLGSQAAKDEEVLRQFELRRDFAEINQAGFLAKEAKETK